MLQKLYVFLDWVWQKIANTLFVRFQFEIDIEKIKGTRPERLIFCLAYGGLIEYFIISSWARKHNFGAILASNRKRLLLVAKPLYFFQVLFRTRPYSHFVLGESGPKLLFCSPKERKKLFKPTEAEILLSEIYTKGHKDFLFVPIFIQWRKNVRGPHRNLSEYLLGLSSNPNVLGKLWYLLRQRRDSVVRSLDVFSFNQTEETKDRWDEEISQRIARMTRRKILVTIHQEMRVVLGPRFTSTYAVKESILNEPEIQEIIEAIALRENKDPRKVLSEAYQYLNEIVSNYRYRTVEVCFALLTWLFKKVFDGLNVKPQEVEQVREAMKTKPVVFVACHRSHFDYLLIPYVLFLNDMVTPYTAAGINLAFWPIGGVLRGGGAFFIRRSFRGNALYSLCLKKYVEYLLKNRFNVKFFIEGTRSRTGRMLPPAYGILKMIVEACNNQAIEDVALIPTSLCYDEIPEQGAYSRELAGEQKTKESAVELLKSRDIVKRNLGKVYVRFAPHLSVRSLLQREKVENISPTLGLQKTAFQICKTINDITPITPKAILSSVLLSETQNAFQLDKIHRLNQYLLQYASYRNYPLVTDREESLRRVTEQLLKKLQKSGVLAQNDAKVPRDYFCDPKKRLLLSIYRNSAVHCFTNASVFNLSLFSCLSEVQKEGSLSTVELMDRIRAKMLSLRNLFKFEFFFSPTKEFIEEVRMDFTFFFPGIDREEVPKLGLAALKSMDLSRIENSRVFLKMFSDLFESYLFLLRQCRRYENQIVEKKVFLQKSLKAMQGELNQKVLNYSESISQQNLLNGLQFFENQKWVTTHTDSDKKHVEFFLWSDAQEALQKELLHFQEISEIDPRNFLAQFISKRLP